MRTSVSLNDELASYVDETASSAGENDAEAIREVVKHARHLEDLVDDLETENERLQERVDELDEDLEQERARSEDLRRQLQQANARDDDVQELARYVEDERRVEQRVREANALTRIKWKLFGMDVEA